ncbi:MAG: peptide chain release factor N(5)-glutamine methyltransferase [Acidobacteria bacterium]|nr:peptide chain release factor N(5)-glutamine methyltransferase [Acidobacteriota bacterium]
MRLNAILRSAIDRLTAAGVGSPRMNAEVLLMFTLTCDRAYLYAHPERELSLEESARYWDALCKRAGGVPAQYITGHQEFWGMDLVVTPAVLIPRPETEHLIEAALPLARDLAQAKIVDVGTGSGAIALALARELPSAEIYATDLSRTALEVAQANAARHCLERRVSFYRADLLEAVPGQFDLIVSNPPYVGEQEADQVQLEVRKFEPRDAVFAGRTGTEVIARLIPQAEEKLRPGGWLILEISGTIVDDVRRLLSSWDELHITPDLQRIPRVAAAKRPITRRSRP